MLRSFITFIFLAVSILGIAQNELEIENVKARKIRHLANGAERTGDLYLSLAYYKKLIEINPTNVKDQYHIAELFRHTRDYVNAETYYEKIVKNASNKFPEALFYLGTMQKANGKYKEAIETFGKFKKASTNVSNENIKKLYKTELEGAQLALNYKDSVAKEIILPMPDINNPHIDFSPIPVTENKFIFGSVRENKAKFFDADPSPSKEKQDTTEVPPTRKFYVGEKEGDGKWKFKGEWAGPFNSKDVDIANGTFSLDKNRFYFTKCEKNWQYKVICKIYYSEKKGEEWSTPVLMDNQINMPEYTSSHPTVGQESKKKQEVIYFVSDRPGTRGGLDIWYTEYDARKKTFKEPKNAGSKINSVGTETTPFYDAKTKTLYFSSDGKANLGGLDVYKSMGEINKFGVPVNLGPKINSPADDLDFALNEKGSGGFVVSNRAGGQSLYNATCCDDIYEFKFTKFIEFTSYGKITDKDSNCVGDAILSVYIVNGEEKYLSEEIKTKDCNYRLHLRSGYNYIVEANKDGYFNHAIDISTKNMLKSDSAKHNFSIAKVPEKPLLIPNLNYEFNSPKLTAESKVVLDTTIMRLLTQNPTLIIELSTHTDSKGGDDYNLKLSQRRAEAVQQYLIEKGIDKSRLIAKGYGETVPIAPNTNKDGSDNPEGRQLNRRTEIKIIGKLDPTAVEEKEEKEAKKKDSKEKESE
ncbi:MAG TPA: OmpA family protein [Bacteroidia bacterium]|jgi:outer membrane protein OmpA-like peptidoglycan-associated protein/tetratricopeptide (TPR) repeat protein|nr:OmpA family protein [Bacteroidia bacterium]